MYYSEMFGFDEVFEKQSGVSISPTLSENARYSKTVRGSMAEKARVLKQDLADLKFRSCFYSYIDTKGNIESGKEILDFFKLTVDNTTQVNYLDFKKFYNEDLIKNKIIKM